MSVLPQQRTKILSLIEKGLPAAEIAQRVGVGIMVVAGYKAARSRAESDEVTDALEATIGLERDLQGALRRNIEQLERGLTITDGGKEKKVASGFIDITAEDKRGAIVVIEIKTGKADRETVGQIVGYMGDLSSAKKGVRGIIVASDFAPAAVAALGAVQNLQLKRYTFKFSFESVERGARR